MYEIEFEKGGLVALPSFTNEAIENTRLQVEKSIGEALSVDSRSGFPGFTVYEDGAEIAVG